MALITTSAPMDSKRANISVSSHEKRLSEASEKITTGSYVSFFPSRILESLPRRRSAALSPMILSSPSCHHVPSPVTAAARSCLAMLPVHSGVFARSVAWPTTTNDSWLISRAGRL